MNTFEVGFHLTKERLAAYLNFILEVSITAAIKLIVLIVLGRIVGESEIKDSFPSFFL